ncbi:MAG: hypothetical protein AAF335_03220 [Bacteroidota bacterium]
MQTPGFHHRIAKAVEKYFEGKLLLEKRLNFPLSYVSVTEAYLKEKIAKIKPHMLVFLSVSQPDFTKIIKKEDSKLLRDDNFPSTAPEKEYEEYLDITTENYFGGEGHERGIYFSGDKYYLYDSDDWRSSYSNQELSKEELVDKLMELLREKYEEAYSKPLIPRNRENNGYLDSRKLLDNFIRIEGYEVVHPKLVTSVAPITKPKSTKNTTSPIPSKPSAPSGKLSSPIVNSPLSIPNKGVSSPTSVPPTKPSDKPSSLISSAFVVVGLVGVLSMLTIYTLIKKRKQNRERKSRAKFVAG